MQGWDERLLARLFLRGHSRIMSRKGGEGLLIFVTKCDKGWVGCFRSVLSYFKNN